MKVFVWKSYGDLEVFDISTVDQKIILKKSLVEVLQSEGYSDVNTEMSFGEVVEIVSETIGYSDMFEYGTGIYGVKG